MKPGMEFVLELLRGQHPARAGDPAGREAEWQTALTLAEQENILPFAVSLLRSQQIALTPALVDRLQQIERNAAVAAFYWTSELKSVLRAFASQQVPVVPLKGPFLAERLYGSADLRVCRDLDLLVAHADLPRAEAILTSISFVPGVPDDYHRAWSRGTTMVELHYDVENPFAFNFDIASALRRAYTAEFHGEPCAQLAQEDELLFLCLHAVRHRFDGLNLVLDLQLAFEKLPTQPWHPRPEVAHPNHLLALGLAMARLLKPNLTVSFDLDIPQPEQQHLDKLADRLWAHLLTQSSEPPDWRALHAFYLELELPGWPRLRRRYRHLRILLGRAIEPDYQFAERLGLPRPWQVRVLRPVRLLSDLLRR